MSSESQTITEQTAASEHSPKPGLFSPDVSMMLLTWVTFFALLAILYKFAWKPILTALDNREEMIRRSVEDAEKIRLQLAKASEDCKKLLDEAQDKAKTIVDQSRKAAVEAAKVIDQKTRDEVQILLENATSEIKAAKEKAQAELREESVQIAINLAGKIVQENFDNNKNREFVNRLLKQL